MCAFGQGTGEFVTVRSDFPANDVQGMIEETKKNPGKYRFGVNPGATSNYMAVVFEKAGAKFNLISSGSASDRVVALKGNHLDIILAGMPGRYESLPQRLEPLSTPNRRIHIRLLL